MIYQDYSMLWAQMGVLDEAIVSVKDAGEWHVKLADATERLVRIKGQLEHIMEGASQLSAGPEESHVQLVQQVEALVHCTDQAEFRASLLTDLYASMTDRVDNHFRRTHKLITKQDQLLHF
jgi:hypothetical protein